MKLKHFVFFGVIGTFVCVSATFAEKKCPNFIRVAGIKSKLELKAEKEKDKAERAKEAEEARKQELFADTIKSICKTLKSENRILTQQELILATGPDFKEFAKHYGGYEGIIEAARELDPEAFEKVRARLVRTFTTVSKANGELATMDQVASKLGVDQMRDLLTLLGNTGLFKDWKELENEAFKSNPEAFEDVKNPDVYSEQKKSSLLNVIRNSERFVYAAVMVGRGFPIDEGFFAALKTYHEKTGAPVILKAINNRTFYLDRRLLDTPWIHIITDDIELSPWFRLNTIEQLPKQINQLTGLNGRWPRNQTQIIAAPKAEVKSVSMHDRDIPHILVTTGTISEPRYTEKKAKVVQRRTARLASEDHFLGAVVVQKNNGDKDFLGVQSAGSFDWRHIEYIPEAQGFMDLNYFYSADGKVQELGKVEAISLGDSHAVRSLDQKLLGPVAKLIKTFHPKRIVLHDFMDGDTVNHHESKRGVTMSRKANHDHIDVSKEFDQVAAFINALLAMDPNVEIVLDWSNHPAWVLRWLQDKKFLDDPVNAALGAELFAVAARGEDPLEYAFNKQPVRFQSEREHFRQTRIQDPERVKFIPREAPGMKVGPNQRLVEVGQHGDAGPDGAGANLKSLHEAGQRGVAGHHHYYARRNGQVIIGTGTYLNVGYNSEGASSWSQEVAITGPNGEVQVYIFQDGGFYRDPQEKLMSPDQFWLKDVNGNQYPRYKHYLEPLNDAQMEDQWSHPPTDLKSANEN